MDRDFVWEANYGERKKLTSFMKVLLKQQDATSLQAFGIFVNNNPYNLELFIFVSYGNPMEEDLVFMKEGLKKIGLVYRKDITFDEMLIQMGNRQYDYKSIIDEDMVDLVMDNSFWIPERDELEQLGYRFKPFGKKRQIFISHASVDKEEIEKIMPYINAINMTVWVDKFDINVGESIEKKVFEGVDNSEAVIFWITKSFFESEWCRNEMERFVKRALNEDVLIINVVDVGIEMKNISKELTDIKYIQRKSDDYLEDTVEKIIQVIKKKYSVR